MQRLKQIRTSYVCYGMGCFSINFYKRKVFDDDQLAKKFCCYMIKYKIPVLKKYYTLQKRVKGNFHAD